MALVKFSCTRLTSWHKGLLPLVVMACFGFAGSSAAAPAQPDGPMPAPFACAPGEWSGKDAHRLNVNSAGGLREPATPLRAGGLQTAAEISRSQSTMPRANLGRSRSCGA